MKVLLFSVIAVVVFIFGFLFAAKNNQVVTVELFITQFNWTAAQFIAVAFILGFLAAAALGAMLIIGLKVKLKRIEQKYSQQSKEVDNLRTLPVKDQI